MLSDYSYIEDVALSKKVQLSAEILTAIEEVHYRYFNPAP